jgi:hypothetical protein
MLQSIIKVAVVKVSKKYVFKSQHGNCVFFSFYAKNPLSVFCFRCFLFFIIILKILVVVVF